ncbi:MAG TPA: sugar phosphate isomerase/epimerase [Sphingobacterium sp.]|nr:sugar phosphate isomerase/epimerase [Sphingobacterium sp.]
MRKTNVFKHLLMPLAALLVLCSMQACKAQKLPEKALGWDLSAQAYSFNRYTFEEAVEFTKNAGLKSIEGYFGQRLSKDIDEELSAELSEEGKAFVKDVLSENDVKLLGLGVVGADDEAGWKELFEFASGFGVEFLNIEPDEQFLPLIGELASEYKIRVGIHNHPKPTHYWDPEVVLKAIDKADSPYVGACADIGHWVRSGLDPVESLQKYEGKLFNLHMKDLNEQDPKAHDVHWGEGVSDIKAIIAELKRQTFQGNISAEYEYNWDDNYEDIKISAENFRNMLKQE